MDRDKTRPEKPKSRPWIDDRLLLRLLHGELSAAEAAELRRRLEDDGSAAARFRELERLWAGLALPPPDPAPPGFAARVAARAAEGSGRTWIGAGAPFGSAWARAAAGAALAAGIVAGLGAGWIAGERGPTAVGSTAAEDSATAGELEAADWAYFEEEPPTLAESYWDAFYEASEEAEL